MDLTVEFACITSKITYAYAYAYARGVMDKMTLNAQKRKRKKKENAQLIEARNSEGKKGHGIYNKAHKSITNENYWAPS